MSAELLGTAKPGSALSYALFDSFKSCPSSSLHGRLITAGHSFNAVTYGMSGDLLRRWNLGFTFTEDKGDLALTFVLFISSSLSHQNTDTRADNFTSVSLRL